MTDKRHEGRDEPILEPDLIIVDAHFHLFDRPGMRYLFEDYLESVNAGHKIVSSVYVETLAFARPDGPEIMRGLGEIEFANGVAAMAASGRYGACLIAEAIVGHARLSVGDGIAEYLDHAIELAPRRLRGVREVALDHARPEAFRYIPKRPPSGMLGSAAFRDGFAHLASRGLSFDAAVFDTQLDDLAELADAFPETDIILNHMGFAMAIDCDAQGRQEIFVRWRDAMRNLARRENVTCKIGGLGLPPWGFGFDARQDAVGYQDLAEAWAPYVETAIDSFGVDRCMMESDYPPDARSCGFVPLWNALKYIVRDFTSDEKEALFSGTARRAYRIDGTGLLLSA
jgi:predicted TIM-barrel fold metal-dependent hydrolase